MNKKKLLFVFPRKIFPIIGGDQIRAYQQLEFLTEIFDVHIVYLNTEKEDDDFALKFMPQLKSSKCFAHSKWNSMTGLLTTFFNLKPLQVNYYTNKALKDYVKAIEGDFDFFFAGNTRVTQYIVDIPKYKYLDLVDAASMNCKNAIPKARGLKKLAYLIDSYLMKKYELLMIQRFDRCAIISEVDKKFLENG